MNLGINLSFAVKRWPEPEKWARFVKKELDLDLVQFTFDLLDPWTPANLRGKMAQDVKKAADDWGIKIDSAFAGLAAYTYNNLLHPQVPGRQTSMEWWKRALQTTAEIGAKRIGSPLGAMSASDYADPQRADYLYHEMLDSIGAITGQALAFGIEQLIVEATPLAREIPHTAQQAAKLLKDLDGRCSIPVKILIDVGHAMYKPLYGDVASIRPWFDVLKRDISCFHIQNMDFMSDAHWGWPHEGGLFDFDGFLNDLKAFELDDLPGFIEIIYAFEEKDEKVISNIKSTVNYCKNILSGNRG